MEKQKIIEWLERERYIIPGEPCKYSEDFEKQYNYEFRFNRAIEKTIKIIEEDI